MNWLDEAQLPPLSEATRRRLQRLHPMNVPRGTPLFHPGDAIKGFVVMISGCVDVFLSGPTGREILLYEVTPGESCIQSTLGLMSGEAYSGEAVTREDSRLVLIPQSEFAPFMTEDAAFRGFVFRTFAERLQSMMHLLEQVAFIRVEARLARCLLDRAKNGQVHATHAELAAQIGSAREVISRRLEKMAQSGALRLERGIVVLQDTNVLQDIAKTDGRV